MEKTLKDFIKHNTMKEHSEQVKPESCDDAADTINGVNVMRLPSRDAYSFALQLMDILFTREELASCLMFKSKKSDKPALDHEKVEKILQYVEQKYGLDKWDIKTMTAKANQKCRDSAKLITATTVEKSSATAK